MYPPFRPAPETTREGERAVEEYRRALDLITARDPGAFACFEYEVVEWSEDTTPVAMSVPKPMRVSCECFARHHAFHVESVDGTVYLAIPCTATEGLNAGMFFKRIERGVIPPRLTPAKEESPPRPIRRRRASALNTLR